METKLDRELHETQQSLMQEMREHGLLANSKQRKQGPLASLMKPIEEHLQVSFNTTRDVIDSLAENKNYFAMSLKQFFISLSTEEPDLLELMCHNYVH